MSSDPYRVLFTVIPHFMMHGATARLHIQPNSEQHLYTAPNRDQGSVCSHEMGWQSSGVSDCVVSCSGCSVT